MKKRQRKKNTKKIDKFWKEFWPPPMTRYEIIKTQETIEMIRELLPTTGLRSCSIEGYIGG